MVVTEMLDGASELNLLNEQTPKIKSFSGISLYDGMVSGNIYLHEPYIRITQFIADDIEAEHLRLRQATETLETQCRSDSRLVGAPLGRGPGDAVFVASRQSVLRRDRGAR